MLSSARPQAIDVRILFIGDVVGSAGLRAIAEHLPVVITEWKIDLAIVNGENSAENGFGITTESYQWLVDAGADVVTLGNHSWHKKEALEFIERSPRLIRPINYLPNTPGRGMALVETKSGSQALVICALGRLFMEPVEDPFGMIDREIRNCPLLHSAGAIVVDFHGEATSEKQAAGNFYDGRISLLAGTHTHVPSADHRILPGGTAYMSDIGMTGDYNSVVGMRKDDPIRRFTRGIPPFRLEPATGTPTMSGVAVETDDATGLAIKVAPVRLGGVLERAVPAFWRKSA
jgi:2',3'-cyclic-nucleotide 2'-phosphodiesterase